MLGIVKRLRNGTHCGISNITWCPGAMDPGVQGPQSEAPPVVCLVGSSSTSVQAPADLLPTQSTQIVYYHVPDSYWEYKIIHICINHGTRNVNKSQNHMKRACITTNILLKGNPAQRLAWISISTTTEHIGCSHYNHRASWTLLFDFSCKAAVHTHKCPYWNGIIPLDNL